MTEARIVTGSLVATWDASRLSVESIAANRVFRSRPIADTGWIEIAASRSAEGIQGFSEYAHDLPALFLFRRSNYGGVLVSTSSDLVIPMLPVISEGRPLYAPRVNVPKLVQDIVARPGPYVLGVVYAKVFGDGHSLRSIALYGADLGDSSLFGSILKSLWPFRVSLRSVSEDSEVASISARGELSFQYKEADSLKRVDALLAHLSPADGGYINWERLVAIRR